MGKRGPGGGGDKVRPPKQTRWVLPQRPYKAEDPADYLMRWIEATPVEAGILEGSRFHVQDWQREFLAYVYGDFREVSIAVLSVPRKNGKTGLAARLCLAHLCGPESEPMGEVYSAANDRAQAAITYRAMLAVIRRVPALQERLIVRDYDRSIEDTVTGSRYQALSSDVPTKHGLSASFIVYDELGQARDRELYDVLETSMGARSDPLMLVISTQAPIDAHIMSELVDEVESPTRDASMYGIVHRAPPTADIWDEAVWHEANPALGTFRSLKEFRAAARRAFRLPSRRASFRNLYLNQRIAPDSSFLDVAEWDACATAKPLQDGPTATKELSLHADLPCFIGLDLAKTADLNAMIAYFPSSGVVLDWVWASDEQVDAAQAPYRSWSETGHLLTTPGRSVNKRAIALQLAALMETYDVQRVTVDRWAIEELERVIDEEGIYIDLCPMGQGYRDMSPAVAMLESAIVERAIVHRGSPLMSWCFSNLEIDEDPAGNRKFTKKRARGAIDPMVALLMALQGAADAPPARSFAGSVLSFA